MIRSDRLQARWRHGISSRVARCLTPHYINMRSFSIVANASSGVAAMPRSPTTSPTPSPKRRPILTSKRPMKRDRASENTGSGVHPAN